jgi:hypothetical protein
MRSCIGAKPARANRFDHSGDVTVQAHRRCEQPCDTSPDVRTYGQSELQMSPNPALASDLTPVILVAGFLKLNLLALAQHADDVSVTARGIVNIHVAGHCCLCRSGRRSRWGSRGCVEARERNRRVPARPGRGSHLIDGCTTVHEVVVTDKARVVSCRATAVPADGEVDVATLDAATDASSHRGAVSARGGSPPSGSWSPRGELNAITVGLSKCNIPNEAVLAARRRKWEHRARVRGRWDHKEPRCA